MNVQHLENVVSHLYAALRQQSPSDDKIIMGHVQEAYDAARKALIVYEGRDHYHVSGTTVGKHIDECAVCGRDIRDPIHRRAPLPPQQPIAEQQGGRQCLSCGRYYSAPDTQCPICNGQLELRHRASISSQQPIAEKRRG